MKRSVLLLCVSLLCSSFALADEKAENKSVETLEVSKKIETPNNSTQKLKKDNYGSVEAFSGFGTSSALEKYTGFRGGYTFSSHFYLGGTLAAGGISASQVISIVGFYQPAASRILRFSTVDYGYAARVSEDFILLPYLGMGVGSLSNTDSSQSTWFGIIGQSSQNATETRLVAVPGIKFISELRSFYLGGDIHYFVFPRNSSLSLGGVVGLRF